LEAVQIYLYSPHHLDIIKKKTSSEAGTMKLITLGIILTMILTPSMAVVIGSPDLFGDESKGSGMIIGDSTPPVSTVESVPNIVFWPENIYSRPTVFVKWFGTDDLHGTGIQHYDVQIMMRYIGTNPHITSLPTWEDWLVNTTKNNETLTIELDYIYYFRCRATDYNNNVEPWSELWGAITVAVGVTPNTLDEISEIIDENRRDHYRDDDDEDDEDPKIPDRKDKIPPESRVEPLPPVHFIVQPHFFIQNLDLVSVLVYPYPPSYHFYGWLIEKGIISEWYDSASIPLSWVGHDNPSGSGIESYDVQSRHPEVHVTIPIAEDSIAPGPPYSISKGYSNVAIDTVDTETVFLIYDIGLYQFRCRARDAAGNVEDYPEKFDTSVYVIDLRMDLVTAY
jgi:hypothetical protein